MSNSTPTNWELRIENSELKTYILAFGPHPDDADIWCGGLLAKTAQEGKSNVIIDICPSQLSTRGTVETRMQEAQEAAKILGASKRVNLMLNDLAIKDDDTTRLIIAKQIRLYRPEIILLPYDIDRHPDHEAAAQLIKHSIFVAWVSKVAIDGLEPHRPRLALQYMIREAFEPDLIISHSQAHYDTKLQAFHAFKSQNQTNARADQYFLGRSLQLGWQAWSPHGEWYKLYGSKLGVQNLDNISGRNI